MRQGRPNVVRIWLLLAVAPWLAGACDQSSAIIAVPSLDEPTIADGWRQGPALEAHGDFPAVTAVLPDTLRITAATGIEAPNATFAGTGMSVRFDYGARAHAGCGRDPCRFYGATLRGMPAQASVSPLPPEEAPLVRVHDYFVPLAPPSHASQADPLAGTGLGVTIKCGHPRVCGSADELARLVRFRPTP